MLSWIARRFEGRRFVDEVFSREHRCALGTDKKIGWRYLSIPVSNRLVDYEEYYRLSEAEYEAFLKEPAKAVAFAERCRRREMDHLLIIKPGRDRGTSGFASDVHTPQMVVDPADGSLKLGDLATLSAGNDKGAIEAALALHVRGARDHGNGYAWLDLQGFLFGGHPCSLSLCFFQGRLAEASWSVSLPGAEQKGGWPTREAIEAEVKFVRSVLAEQLGRPLEQGHEGFPWGAVWSQFDAKGFSASNGLRYGRKA